MHWSCLFILFYLSPVMHWSYLFILFNSSPVTHGSCLIYIYIIIFISNILILI